MSYRWSPYVTPNSPKGWIKMQIYRLRFPYISITDEASDFKFGVQLVFAKANHYNPLEENMGVALG